VFSTILYVLLACVVVRIGSAVLIRRFTRPPAALVWIYNAANAGLWLCVLAAIFLISLIIAAVVVVIVAVCVAVLTLERRRLRRGVPRPPRSRVSG
jgi:FtsH-binding integral membrane protein